VRCEPFLEILNRKAIPDFGDFGPVVEVAVPELTERKGEIGVSQIPQARRRGATEFQRPHQQIEQPGNPLNPGKESEPPPQAFPSRE